MRKLIARLPRKKEIARNIMAWLSYTLLLFGFNALFMKQLRLLDVAVFCGLLAMVFYILFFSIRLLYHRRRRHKAIGLFVLLLLAIGCYHVGYYFIYGLMPKMGAVIYYQDIPYSKIQFMRNYLTTFIHFALYANTYVLARQYAAMYHAFLDAIKRLLSMKESKLLVERERNELEQAFLRQQINPHFLRNSLAFIHARAASHGDGALVLAVELLRSLMDFLLKSIRPAVATIPLHTEWLYVKKYLRLLVVIQGRDDLVVISGNEPGGAQQVPAAALLTLVENAIEHGDISMDNKLELTLGCTTDGSWEFHCRNKKRVDQAPKPGEAQGIGLRNIYRRLYLLTQDSCKLDILEDKHHFTATIKCQAYV